LLNTSRSCDGDLAQKDKGFDVVDEIGHSDLGRCSGDPDSSDEEPYPILLLREHMLDTRADFRFGIVRDADSCRASVEQRHVLPNPGVAQCAGAPRQAP
jgi:hypothetical protein